MEAIKRKWFFISLAYIFIIYYIFIVMLKGSRPTLYMILLSTYVCITAVLFLGNIVGFPGLVLHAFFKKEDKALPFYQTAYRLGSKSPQLLSAYGLVLLRKGEPETAKDIFETALRHNRNFLYTRTLKANIAICDWKLGNPEKAYADYLELYYFPDKEKLADYSPEHLEAGAERNPSFTEQDFLTMGFLALLADDIEAALYFSHIALLKSPNYAAAYDNLGQIYFKTGEKEKAKEAFDKALELKPTLIDSLYYSALLAMENNQTAEAKEYAEKALAQPFNALNTISEEELNALAKSLRLEVKQ